MKPIAGTRYGSGADLYICARALLQILSKLISDTDFICIVAEAETKPTVIAATIQLHKQACKINRPFTGYKVDFILTCIVVEPDLTDILHAESVQEALPSFWHEMPMRYIECPLEIRRSDFIEKLVRLGNVMGDVVDLGVLWFSVVVLKEDNYLCLLRSRY